MLLRPAPAHRGMRVVSKGPVRDGYRRRACSLGYFVGAQRFIGRLVAGSGITHLRGTPTNCRRCCDAIPVHSGVKFMKKPFAVLTAMFLIGSTGLVFAQGGGGGGGGGG